MTPEEFFEEKLHKKAKYIATLVQGTQALEGAALDKEGYERLIQKSIEILRKNPDWVLHED